MVTFRPPLTRVDTTYMGSPTHYYKDGNGTRIPGVTTLLGNGLPKPALINWAASVTAEYAVDHWDELGDKPVGTRLKELTNARKSVNREAKQKGTDVHALAEALVHGIEVEVPEPLAGYVDAYVAWLNEWRPEPVLVEVAVVNYTMGYAGTIDLIVDLAGERWLVDIKTGKAVYGETALQVAAYAHAEFFIDADGHERPMLPVDRRAVLHVRDGAYELRPLPSDPIVFRQFLYVAQVARAVDEMKSYIGAPLTLSQQEVLPL